MTSLSVRVSGEGFHHLGVTGQDRGESLAETRGVVNFQLAEPHEGVPARRLNQRVGCAVVLYELLSRLECGLVALFNSGARATLADAEVDVRGAEFSGALATAALDGLHERGAHVNIV